MSEQETIDNIVESLNRKWSLITSYPDESYLHKDLYEYVLANLTRLQNLDSEGLIRKKITGNFGWRYFIEYEKGAIWKEMSVELRERDTDPVRIWIVGLDFLKYRRYQSSIIVLKRKSDLE